MLSALLGAPQRRATISYAAHWQRQWGNPAAAEFETRGAGGPRRCRRRFSALPAVSVSWITRLADLAADQLPVPAPGQARCARPRLPLTHRSTTAASPTTAGCRSCPSRSAPDLGQHRAGRAGDGGTTRHLPTRRRRARASTAAPVARAGVDRARAGGQCRHHPSRLRPRALPAASAGGIGFSAYRLRRSDFGHGAAARPQRAQDGAISYDAGVRSTITRWRGAASPATAPSPEYAADPHFAATHRTRGVALPAAQVRGYAWGMTVDLNACVGCNACVVACQAENNIPVVGKDQVARGREMHWIRIDRYYAARPRQPETLPPADALPCTARTRRASRCARSARPCTAHEGLNDMVYNRCVGTRYCSQQLPVQGAALQLHTVHTTGHADVAQDGVQSRRHGAQPRRDGEVHLLRAAHQRRACARRAREDARIRDGEVVTACQQACPTEAIVFGDINDRPAAVDEAEDRSRATTRCSNELGTRPARRYLAGLRNPNPGDRAGRTNRRAPHRRQPRDVHRLMAVIDRRDAA